MVQNLVSHDQKAWNNHISEQPGADENRDEQHLILHGCPHSEKKEISLNSLQASAGTVSTKASTAVRMASTQDLEIRTALQLKVT